MLITSAPYMPLIILIVSLPEVTFINVEVTEYTIYASLSGHFSISLFIFEWLLFEINLLKFKTTYPTLLHFPYFVILMTNYEFFSINAPFLSLYKVDIIDSFSLEKEHVDAPSFPRIGFYFDSTRLLSFFHITCTVTS